MGTIFTNYDIRGRAGETLSTEQAWNAGKAFSEWLPEEGDVVAVRSEDADQTILHAFIEGLLLQGRSVKDGGVGDQQATINAVQSGHAVGGVLVAHESAQDQETIALYDSRGVAINMESGLAEINELVESANFVPAAKKGNFSA